MLDDLFLLHYHRDAGPQSSDQDASSGNPAGLCATCAHAKTTRSDRGSIFYRCLLSTSDPRFPKYPRLPVLSCPGYRRDGGKPEEPEHS